MSASDAGAMQDSPSACSMCFNEAEACLPRMPRKCRTLWTVISTLQ